MLDLEIAIVRFAKHLDVIHVDISVYHSYFVGRPKLSLY